MLDKLKEIDTSAIKSLVKLKQEKNQLKNFLAKANKMQEKVDGTVFDRVRNDYENRHAELDMEAVPLKDQAREQYRKLRALRQTIEEAHEGARIDKEELEFRHAVGELADKELEAKLKDAEKVLADRKSELTEAENLQKQFVGAFDSEEELEEEYDDEEEVADDDEEEEVEEDEDDEDEENDERPDQTGEMDADEAMGADQTFIIPEALLVSLTEEGDDQQEYPLGAFNYIGRTEDNQIRLASAGVSRKHALVTASPDGFSIEDLDSQNGTYVNDERIEGQCKLSDGDSIGIGNVQLEFRLLK
jgi:hypothetical protein